MSDPKSTGPVRIFVSYSHKDTEWLRKLEPLLVFPENTARVDIWVDTSVKAGDRWEEKIIEGLNNMDIFLCLLSYNFIQSSFIQSTEKRIALARESLDGILLLPIYITPIDERDCQEFQQFQALPAWNRSWRSYEQGKTTDLDDAASAIGHTYDAHKPIRTGLWDAIELILQRKQMLLAGPTSLSGP